MEVAQQAREDVVSSFLKVSTYKGQTLVSPKEIIVRKVYCNQDISDRGIEVAGADATDGNFTLLNFRALGTSPSSMLSAKVELCVPLWLTNPQSSLAAGGAGTPRNWTSHATNDQSQAEAVTCGPRRNGLLRAMSSISSVVNNTASFTTRPDESLVVADQLWQQVSDVYGPTGCEPAEETGCFGPDLGPAELTPLDDGDILMGTGTTGTKPFSKLAVRYQHDNTGMRNKGFAARRRAFLAGTTLRADANGKVDAGTRTRGIVKYVAKTYLYVPPFKYYNYGTVQPKSPSFLPYSDTVEVSVHWKSAIADIKRALIMAKGIGEGDTRILSDYTLNYAGRPYLNCLYVVPTFTLPPVVTLPCWRTIHYASDFTIPALADTNANKNDLFNWADSTKLDITIPPIRIEALPSLITVHACDSKIASFSDREYFYPIDQFRLTLNEKLNSLSDRDSFDMYKLYRMYSASKMDFETWRDMKCVMCIRGDCLALEKSQSVFSPSTLSFSMRLARKIDQLDSLAEAKPRVHVTFWYMNLALSVSSQSSAVTDLLLDPSQVSRAGVSASSSVITDIMSKQY